MDFTFYMPTKLIGAKSAIAAHASMFTEYGKKCLLVTGGSSAKHSGALDDVTAALEKHDIQYIIFDKITQNPTAAVCCEAGQLARDFDVDFIVGIGGGSALDAAKAVAFYAANKTLAAEDIYTTDISLEPLPLILTGTTAGTGSEVTGVAVLTRANGQKKSVSGKNFYAKLSFADPKYTYTAPYAVTVSTALDAFSHAAEAWFSNRFDPFAESFAAKALPVLWDALKHFFETASLPQEEMRDNLYYASIYAGMALNTCGTCFPHAMGYALTEDFAIPHGKACTVFLPAFIRRGMEFREERAHAFFSLLNTNAPELFKVINALTDIQNVKMSAEQITAYCARWSDNKNFSNSPGGYNPAYAKTLLEELFL